MKRVVVAMSGGVDSAVAASLLVEQGYEAIGITMQIWPEGKPAPATARGCCSLDAVEDARRVCQVLGIPHYVMNLREDFDRTVIRNFIQQYAAGRTPNPCVECNRSIKFEALLKRSTELGAGWIATGHYACTRKNLVSGRWELYKAVDMTKDQSYVLYPLTQDQLEHALFPLGEWTKERTRARAAELGLRVASKPDSQEICFVPDRDYGQFLREAAPDVACQGKIVDTNGRVLGNHPGVAFYTVGQRKGLGLTSPQPLYVTRIDPELNLVVVGSNDEVLQQSCLLRDVNWIGMDAPVGRIAVQSCIRYNMREAPATIEPSGGEKWRLTFETAQRAITPGQSAVMLDGDRVLAGGIIDSE